MERSIVGIDCATDDSKVGLARAQWRDGECRVQEVKVCGRACPPAGLLEGWVSASSPPVLLASDAPLGWPAPLSSALISHSAGGPLGATAHSLFRRATDTFIKCRVGKTPLDVGADRIARTAHSALALLDELRGRLGKPISLAWVPTMGISAIEVYPAATLRAHGFRCGGYKKPGDGRARGEILSSLSARLTLPSDTSILERNGDALDAVVCVLAGQDFLEGRAMRPTDHTLAAKEGWIWVREPGPAKLADRAPRAGKRRS